MAEAVSLHDVEMPAGGKGRPTARTRRGLMRVSVPDPILSLPGRPRVCDNENQPGAAGPGGAVMAGEKRTSKAAPDDDAVRPQTPEGDAAGDCREGMG